MTHRSLALALASLRRLGDGDGPSLAEAADSLNRQSRFSTFPLLALLGMVPSPGLPLGAICGTLIVWKALADLCGLPPRPLPPGLGRRRIPARMLNTCLRYAMRPLRQLEKLARPRCAFLAYPPAALVAVVVQGFVMALPIPFFNTLPGLAIIVLAVALVRHDGLGAFAGHALAVASLAIVAGMGWGVWAALGE